LSIDIKGFLFCVTLKNVCSLDTTATPFNLALDDVYL